MRDPSRARLVIIAELAAAGIKTNELTPIVGGRGGLGYRANTSVGTLVVKLRARPQPLHASARAAELLGSASIDRQEVVLTPRPTSAGWLIALQWVKGRALSADVASDWSPRAAAQFGRDLANWLKRLHALPIPPLDWGSKADARLEAKLSASLARGCIPARTAHDIRTAWPLARHHLDSAPAAFIHRDLHRSNILEDGGRLACVIDFEQSLIADPLYDMAKLIDHVMPMHPSVGPAFRAEYALILEAEDVESRLWAVLVLERLSSMPYFHDRGEESIVEFHRARLEELLARPLRVPGVIAGYFAGD